MKVFVSFALAGASVAVMAAAATSAHAQQAAPAAAPGGETLGEIVVTARRRTESLQEVPQTVNAVTSDTLQKLNITQFSDVQTVVPGLNLNQAATGYQSTTTLRGVAFDVNTAAPLGTVAFYVNDAPVQSSFLFNALFDVGQIEVLRGPQGTTRGVSAPSGAITVTTHKPSLSDWGGYANVTATDQHGRNAQGAINIPIIKDVLAVRAAALIDQTDADGVRSIHNSLRPTAKTFGERVSVSFEPSDAFNGSLTWQHVDRRTQSFDQVSGPGASDPAFPGTVIPALAPALRASYAAINPPITPEMRAAVEDGISDVRTHMDLVTAQIDSRIFGQHLSYVGSYQHQTLHNRNMSPTNSDMGNILPGIELYNFQDVKNEWTTQEIRLSSDPAPGRFYDYTVGAFYNWQNVSGITRYPGPLLLGSFGPNPAVIDLAAYDPRFSIPLTIGIPSSQQETSLFGGVTLHLPYNTELSGGIRHMWTVGKRNTIIEVGNGLVNLGNPAIGTLLPCSALSAAFGPGPAPGQCTLLSASTINNPNRTSDTPNIYNISLSHHFTRDLMAYVNTGTSYRAAFQSVGLSGQILNSTDPNLLNLNNHPAERSRSYEIGFKSTWLDGRLRFNADIFRQHFSNYSLYVPNINYVNAQGQTQFSFTSSVDALVKGFEMDAAYQISREWNVGFQASYSDGEVEGSQVPCNTFDASGRVTFNHSVNSVPIISLCPGGSSSRQPYWNATLTSEYTHPVADNVNGFIRGLLNYWPENKNRAEPNFTVNHYTLVNLYAGLRSQDGAWEVSLFAKNAFGNDTTLDVSPVPQAINDLLGTPGLGFAGRFPTSSGYFATSVTPRREVGLNVHYAWGAR